MPCINAYRDAHACGLPYPDEQQEESGYSTIQEESPFLVDWKRSFYVTLSFADGSHARTHAIQTSLRPYRPRYYHLWQLKTFWHDTKIVEDDLEVHSFESMETVPAVDVKFVSAEVQLVIDEIKAFRNDFLESLRQDNDIAQFWLRKTKKPVLAVLLVKKNNKPILYRGTNMEVSMPTGSLCAERNVIGTALASNPALKRQDLKMVAVLAVPLELVQQQQQQQQKLFVLPTCLGRVVLQAILVYKKRNRIGSFQMTAFPWPRFLLPKQNYPSTRWIKTLLLGRLHPELLFDALLSILKPTTSSPLPPNQPWETNKPR